MIYCVTRGEYSCYRIVAATTDRATAEKITKKFSERYDECRIEEFPDAEIFLKNVWRVYFERSGDVFRCEASEREDDYQEIGRIFDTIYKRDYDLIVIVEADTREDAIKIAAEKRAKYLAEKNGL